MATVITTRLTHRGSSVIAASTVDEPFLIDLQQYESELRNARDAARQMCEPRNIPCGVNYSKDAMNKMTKNQSAAWKLYRSYTR